MYVKQLAHRRCSNAAGSFTLLPGNKTLKEGGLGSYKSTGELLLRWRCPRSLRDCEDPQPFAPRLRVPGTPPRRRLTSFSPTPPCHPGAPHPQKLSAGSSRGSFQIAAGEQGARPALSRLPTPPPPRASAAHPAPGARAPRPATAGAGEGTGTVLRGPSDCGAADRIAALPAPLPPAGPGAAGSSRALRPGRLPQRRAGPEPGSSALQTPPPSPPPPAAPRVPRGWGFPPLPRPPLCMCHRAPCPPARPPTYLPAAPEGARRAEDARHAAQGLSLRALAGRHLTRVPGAPGTLQWPFPRPAGTPQPSRRRRGGHRLRGPADRTPAGGGVRGARAERLPPLRSETRASRPQEPPAASPGARH